MSNGVPQHKWRDAWWNFLKLHPTCDEREMAIFEAGWKSGADSVVQGGEHTGHINDEQK